MYVATPFVIVFWILQKDSCLREEKSMEASYQMYLIKLLSFEFPSFKLLTESQGT